MSDLFKAQYNPDVLSCIANLSNDEVFTPPEVANQMLDLLPKEIWSDPDITFFDPACKSGVFLRECAKRLIEGQLPGYQIRVDEINEKKADGEELDEADESYLLQLESVLENIFKRQLYGMAITELTSLLSRRSVYCSKFPNSDWSVVKFGNPEGNIDYKQMDHDWYAGRCRKCGAQQKAYERDESLESYAYEFIHLDKPEDVFDMKFDVIVSNPPYQLKTGGSKAQAVPIYNYFVDQAKKLNPKHLIMIIPDRWFSGGFGLNDFRKTMLADDRISEIYDYPLASDCFPGVDIPGGICFFHWVRDAHGDCNVTVNSQGHETSITRPLLEPGSDIFVRFNEAIPILHKVSSLHEPTINTIVSSQKPFGLGTQYHGKEFNAGSAVQVYGRNQSISFADLSEIKSSVDLVNDWKVFISAAYGERIPENLFVLGRPFIGAPGTACTETYIAIGPVNNEAEAENLRSYIATKFFRFLVMIRKPTQHTLKNVYGFVPIQDLSTSWTDEALYEKYKLSQSEIQYIEKMIRPMELGGDEDA